MEKGLIISSNAKKYEKKIKSKLSQKYLLHFSCDINILYCAVISGEVAFIAFDPQTLLFDFVDFFSKINALYGELPTFLISNSQISDKARASIERFISHKIIKNFCLDTDIDDFAIFINNLQEKEVSEKLKIDKIYNSLIGKSENTEGLRLFISNVCKREESVLLLGETGCGKTSIAKLIHDLSKRKDKKFISVDMGTIPVQLIETILFGAKKGSYTGAYEDTKGLIEEADNGTLFLDEIENMPLDMQVKLLRVLETHKIREVGRNTEKHIDFRLICASNRNLLEMINEGTFRQDLYYRIKVLNFEIQPLRERKVDIYVLSKYYVKKNDFTISDEALAKLEAAEFKGNIRELFHVIENACLMAGSLKIIYPEYIIFD